MIDLIAFGEVMLRLSPAPGKRLENSEQLDLFLAGSELNVVFTAQRLGLKTKYVTKLPANPLGDLVLNQCRAQGIDMSDCLLVENERLGLYFYEYGSPPRPGMALYDRRYSAISQASPSDFCWEEILRGGRIFLTSGITPALGEGVAEAALAGVRTAKALGLKVAFDLNYRSKLWSIEEAIAGIRPFLEYVDILFTSADDARNLLQMEEPPSPELAAAIASRYHVETVNLIYNPGVANGPLWRIVTIHQGETLVHDQTDAITTVDRLGAGDAFAGGFFYGLLTGGPKRGQEYGNACMVLKNTMLGDLAWYRREEVEAFVAGERGMVKR